MKKRSLIVLLLVGIMVVGGIYFVSSEDLSKLSCPRDNRINEEIKPFPEGNCGDIKEENKCEDYVIKTSKLGGLTEKLYINCEWDAENAQCKNDGKGFCIFCGNGVIDSQVGEDCDTQREFTNRCFESEEDYCSSVICKCLPKDKHCGNGYLELEMEEECEYSKDCIDNGKSCSNCKCVDKTDEDNDKTPTEDKKQENSEQEKQDEQKENQEEKQFNPNEEDACKNCPKKITLSIKKKNKETIEVDLKKVYGCNWNQALKTPDEKITHGQLRHISSESLMGKEKEAAENYEWVFVALPSELCFGKSDKTGKCPSLNKEDWYCDEGGDIDSITKVATTKTLTDWSFAAYDDNYIYNLEGDFVYETSTDTFYNEDGLVNYNPYVYTSFSLDSENNPISEEKIFGSLSFTTKNTYNENYNYLTETTLNSAIPGTESQELSKKTMAYYPDGTIASSTDETGTTKYGWTLGGDGEYYPAWEQYPDGIVITYRYTDYNQYGKVLTQITDGTIITEIRWNFDSSYPRVEGYFSSLPAEYNPFSRDSLRDYYESYFYNTNCEEGNICGGVDKVVYTDSENTHTQETTYDSSSGNPTQIDYCSDISCNEDNIEETWSGDYDDLGYLTSEKIIDDEGKEISKMEYERNDDGFLTKVSSSEDGTTTFEYDDSYTKINYPDGSHHKTETFGSLTYVSLDDDDYINVQDPSGNVFAIIDISSGLTSLYPNGEDKDSYVIPSSDSSLGKTLELIDYYEKNKEDNSKSDEAKVLVELWGKRWGMNPLNLKQDDELPDWEVIQKNPREVTDICSINEVSLILKTEDELMSKNWEEQDDSSKKCTGEICDLKEDSLEDYQLFIKGSSSCAGEKIETEIKVKDEEKPVIRGEVILDKYGEGFAALTEEVLDLLKKASDGKGIDLILDIEDPLGKGKTKAFGFSVKVIEF